MSRSDAASRLFSWLGSRWIARKEVRAEAWALGCRNGGDVERGARAELSSASLPFRRAVLLRLVIRDLRHAKRI